MCHPMLPALRFRSFFGRRCGSRTEPCRPVSTRSVAIGWQNGRTLGVPESGKRGAIFLEIAVEGRDEGFDGVVFAVGVDAVAETKVLSLPVEDVADHCAVSGVERLVETTHGPLDEAPVDVFDDASQICGVGDALQHALAVSPSSLVTRPVCPACLRMAASHSLSVRWAAISTGIARNARRRYGAVSQPARNVAEQIPISGAPMDRSVNSVRVRQGAKNRTY
jgi:hypothetical protein